MLRVGKLWSMRLCWSYHSRSSRTSAGPSWIWRRQSIAYGTAQSYRRWSLGTLLSAPRLERIHCRSGLVCPKYIYRLSSSLTLDTYSTVVPACENNIRRHHHPTWHVFLFLRSQLHNPVTKVSHYRWSTGQETLNSNDCIIILSNM